MQNAEPTPAILLHGGALGDCILAYHLARHLVADVARSLTLVARHPVHCWLKRRGRVAGSAFADAFGVSRLYATESKPTDHLKKPLAEFEIVISLLGPVDSAVDRNLRQVCSGKVFSIDPRPDSSSQHIIQQWLRQIGSPCKTDAVVGNPIAFDRKIKREWRLALSQETGGCDQNPIVIIHPGSGGKRKCPPLDWFERTAAALRDAQWRTVWMIGPDELERDGPPFKSRLESTATVIAKPDITVAADLLAGADAFVGCDSGMAHLAALCGVKTLVWFGPTDPAVWRPIGPDVHVLTDTDQQSFVQRISQLLLT